MEADQNWMDTEFLDDFLQEAKEHLEDIESTILKLEKDSADRNIVNQMFRSFHSLKGLAGFVNQTLIQSIAHDSESLLDCCRKNTVIVDEKFTTIILKSADLIKEICGNIDITNDVKFKDTCMNHVKELKNFISTGCNVKSNNANDIKAKVEKVPEPAVKKEDIAEEKKEIVKEEVQEEIKEIKKEEPAVIQRNQKYEEEKASVANILARIEGKKTEEPKTEEMLTVDMIINGKAKPVEEAPVVVKEKTVEKPVEIEKTQYIEKAEPKKEIIEDATYKENKNKEVKRMQDKEAIKSGKYLTFSLGTEDYGIPIQTVREIIGMMHITNIPKTPEFIKGVVNLRGKIIPIMDLRLKFGLEKKDYGERTCIIVVEIKAESGHRNIGIVVDMVSEVLNINQSEIEMSPQDDVQNDGEFITGMGKVKDKVVMLIDIEKVLSKEEFKYIKDMKGGV